MVTEGRKGMMGAEGPLGSFEDEMAALQKRIGYDFRNQYFLTQALTDSAPPPNDKAGTLSNKNPERAGDAFLARAVAAYVASRSADSPELATIPARQRLDSMLRSNWYLSRAALAIGIDRSVKVKTQRVHSSAIRMDDRGERQARLTADALEALIGAIIADSGEAGALVFLEQHVFDDTALLQTLSDFSSDNLAVMKKAFSKLTRGKGTIERKKENPRDFDVRYDGKNVLGTLKKTKNIQPVWEHAFLLLQENPWVLWEYGGPASLVMPQKEKGKKRRRKKERL